MKQTLVEVLIYLFHNYMKESHENPEEVEQALASLEEMAIDVGQLEQACQELSEAGLLPTSNGEVTQHPLSIRVYNTDECNALDTECRGLLFTLEQLGLMSAENRETIIEQVMASNAEHVEFDEFKWFVLFTILKDESLTNRIVNSDTVLTHKDLSEEIH